MSRPGERKQSSDIQLSLTPPHPPLPGPPDGCKFPFFSPNLWVFSTTFGDPPPAERRRVDRSWRGRRRGWTRREREARAAGAPSVGCSSAPLPVTGVGRGDVVCTHRPGSRGARRWALPRTQSDKRAARRPPPASPPTAAAALPVSRLASHNKSPGAELKLSICRSVMGMMNDPQALKCSASSAGSRC